MRSSQYLSKNICWVITRLCWMITLCLSLYVLKYTVALNTLPLDFTRSTAVAAYMTETVFFCVALILLAQIVWEVVIQSVKEE